MSRTLRLSGVVLAVVVFAATSALADTYLVYSEKGIGQSPCDNGACYFQYCLEGDANCLATEPGCLWDCGIPGECDVPEGDSYQRHEATWNIDDGYVGWGTQPKACDACPVEPMDMRSFAGDFRMFVRVDPAVGNHRVKVEFECDPDSTTYPAGVSYVTFISDHGWQTNTDWQEIVIPLVDGSFTTVLDLNRPTTANQYGFEEIVPFRPLDDACFSNVQVWSKVTLEGVDSGTVFATMSTDFIRWEKPNNHTGASDVTTDGHQLKVDGKPFVVNAVAYNPIDVGENWQFTWVDRADRYDVDYPLISDMGANAVRVYAPLVTTSMLDKAWAEGLFVIPTVEVESTNLECAQGKSYVEDRFADTVSRWKDHPAVLFWLVGNEVNNNLTPGVDLCADWYPQLNAMALAAENAGSTHPVGTAVAEMADVCTTCSDDTSLPNVDLWGVQLYRGCDFGTAFSDYAAKPDCGRPLIVTEAGVDAFHQPQGGGGSEDQTIQANCLDTLVEDAHDDLAIRPGGAEVLSGHTIFEWADEWWKTDCPTCTWSTHDTNNPWTAGGFPDGKGHEEWFGLMSLDAGDPSLRPARTARTTVAEKWLGPVCGMQVTSFNQTTGDATISFASPTGEVVDTTLHYGPLSDVSFYGYTGSLPGLGTTGSANVTLPAGDLFWVIAGENVAGEEGCYGMDSAGTERPCFSGNCTADQVSGWNCFCSSSP
jgi:hypothetical protein